MHAYWRQNKNEKTAARLPLSEHIRESAAAPLFAFLSSHSAA
jgi:hypothetical protein